MESEQIFFLISSRSGSGRNAALLCPEFIIKASKYSASGCQNYLKYMARLNFYIERLPEFFREHHLGEQLEMKSKFFSLMEEAVVKNDLV